MNRKLFRKLIREEGWTLVSIPRNAAEPQYARSTPLVISASTNWTISKENFLEMAEWCKTVGIKDDEFVCRLMKEHGTHAPGTKEFLFKHMKHASMFTLKWLT